MSIESSLLYIKPDGTQDFVHDSYKDFFLAKWLAEDTKHVDQFWREVLTSSKNERVQNTIQKRIEARLRSVSGRNLELLRHMGVDKPTGIEKELPGLHLAKNALVFYCGLPDSSYLIESGLKLIGDTKDFKSSAIRLELANLIRRANYVSQDTIDSFILKTMGHVASFAIGPFITMRNLMNLILEKGRDPIGYFRKYYGSDEFKALRGLANAYVDIDRPKDAIPYYEKAFEIGHPEAWDYIILGDYYMQIKKFERAIELFQRGRTMEPLPIFDQGIKIAKSGKYKQYWLES